MATRSGGTGWAVGRPTGVRPTSTEQYIRVVVATVGRIWAQVTEGDVEVLNVREVDERLGPLINGLVALGVASLVLTMLYWWFTRPRRPVEIEGDDNG